MKMPKARARTQLSHRSRVKLDHAESGSVEAGILLIGGPGAERAGQENGNSEAALLPLCGRQQEEDENDAGMRANDAHHEARPPNAAKADEGEHSGQRIRLPLHSAPSERKPARHPRRCHDSHPAGWSQTSLSVLRRLKSSSRLY